MKSAVASLSGFEALRLGNYTFDLLEVRHHPRLLYPVWVSFNLEDSKGRDDGPYEVGEEASFRNVLERFLKSPQTVSVIRTLKAQTSDPDSRPPMRSYSPPPAPSSDDDDIPF